MVQQVLIAVGLPYSPLFVFQLNIRKGNTGNYEYFQKYSIFDFFFNYVQLE